MYTRWKKIKEELNVKKEYIKEIRKSAWEAGLKMITLEDEEGTQVDILYYLPKKHMKYLLIIQMVFHYQLLYYIGMKSQFFMNEKMMEV